MSSRFVSMGKFTRYLQRFREAGPRNSLLVMASRASGYIRWPSNLWSRWRGYHLGPRASSTSRKSTLPADFFFDLLWDQESLAQIAEVMRTAEPGLGRTLIQRADSMLADGVQLLGWGSASLHCPVAWNTDPRSDVQWPDRFHKLVSAVREGKSCDVKFPWELSRLQCLPVISGAWLVSQDQHYLEEAWKIVLDWSKKNPVGYGINWTCSMEVAIRSINLAAAANLLSSGLEPARKEFLAQLLRAHEFHLRWNLEISDVSGNHLLFDYLGIAILSMALNGRKSARFLLDASVLATEAENQFHADGVHIEHATGYQRLVLEGIVIFLIAIRQFDVTSSARLAGVASRALLFVEAICDGNGALPAIGDSDSGNVLKLGNIAGNHAAQLLEFYAAAGLGGPATHRCLDASARAWFDRKNIPNPVSITTEKDVEQNLRAYCFNNGGYHVIRGLGMVLVLRAGPSGLGGRGSHDHNDQLSIVLSMDDQPILIDPGTVTYTEDFSKHAWDLATAHHNTVSLEGLEQSLITRGSVTCTVQNARGNCRSFTTSALGSIVWVADVHYGNNTADTIEHSRRVSAEISGSGTLVVEIRDSVRSPGALLRQASANFLLHPDCRVAPSADSRSIQILVRDTQVAQLNVAVGAAPKLLSDTAAVEYGGTWHSHRLSVPLDERKESLVRLELLPRQLLQRPRPLLQPDSKAN